MKANAAPNLAKEEAHKKGVKEIANILRRRHHLAQEAATLVASLGEVLKEFEGTIGEIRTQFSSMSALDSEKQAFGVRIGRQDDFRQMLGHKLHDAGIRYRSVSSARNKPERDFVELVHGKNSDAFHSISDEAYDE